MSKGKILIVFLILILGAAGFFIYYTYFDHKAEVTPVAVKQKTVLKLDPQKEATHLSKIAGEKGVYWMRGLPILWNDIEKKKGGFDWSSIDNMLIGDKNEYFAGDTYHIAMVWPYTNWDQDTCHKEKKYIATGHLKRGGEELKMGAPCDMNAYAQFLSKVVERYDGDGIDDQPGLKIPIKYWEIMNEPEMQGGKPGGAGEDLKFFVGTSKEYLAILKTSYETIKKADSEAMVAHGGMAGMQKEFQDFWSPVFANGGGNYFDIANMHTINTDERREDMYITKFKKYLAKYGIKNKPIWVTEVQFGDLMGKPKDLTSFEETMVRATIFTLAQGADKLFYIENWTQWDNPDAYKPKEEDEEKEKSKPKPKIDLSSNTTHKVYLNLVTQVNNFTKIEILKEKIAATESNKFMKDGPEGTSAEIGQYKFTSGNKVVYVLWGKAEVPAEITGEVRVTDIYGTSKEIGVLSIQLSDSPIFIEIIK